MVDRRSARFRESHGTLGFLVFLALVAAAATPAARAQAATATPLASAPTNWDGVELSLIEVERKGNVLTVKWAVSNGGSEEARVKFGLTRKADTYVVDEENGTKYYVLTDKEGHALASKDEWINGDTSGIDEKVPAGGTKRFWAKFPAPPPGVETLTVLMAQTEPFEDVPVTDK